LTRFSGADGEGSASHANLIQFYSHENVMFPRDAVDPSERFMAAKRKAYDQLSRKRLELMGGVWEFYTNECGQS
jgi:hypothetical protein